MAYEALDNLQQTLDLILKHRDDLVTPSVKQEIISIRDQSVVLQMNLKHYPNKERIREEASKIHEVIQYFFSEENVSIKPAVRLTDRLRELAALLESIVGDVVDCIKGKDSASSVESTVGDVADYIKLGNDSVSSTRSKDVMVGLKKNLKVIKRRLFSKHGSKTDSADVSSSSRSRSAIRSSKDDEVVGLEEDVKVIKDRLSNWKGSPRLEVIPIVGTGGIGKTTLAKILYNHASVNEYFDICAWVTISQDHSVERIVQNLLASMKGISTVRDAEIESLIREHLELSSYLIVMDDMWSKKAWDDVKMMFPEAYNGSRIIVTTRMQDVADYVSSSNGIHTMSLLDEHHSWKLLKRKVFGYKKIPIELEDIGKKIVQNCGGLPLSIMVVAGLLSKVYTRSSWEKIAANDGQLETIICLSYTHLPYHLKSCLLYMAGFPEDHEIRVTELVNLWISEGFVMRSKNGSESLEEEAEDCLENLVERSLVLVTSRKFDGKIKSCSLHDTVREFCIRQAAKEKVILSAKDYLPTPILRNHFVPRLIKDHHRISASSYDLHLKDYVHSSHIRTIICIPKKGYRSKGVVEKFSSLRVLHVLRRNNHWDWEPGQVFDLVHLTYLASNIPNSIVPSAISKLQNLQTLIIYRYGVRLPMEIWRLRQLRHLIALSFQPLPYPEGENNPLENLQELSLATALVWSKKMVEMIPNIKKLGICYSKKKFDSDARYRLNNLKYLCRLEKLKLQMHGDFSIRELVLEKPAGGFPLRAARKNFPSCPRKIFQQRERMKREEKGGKYMYSTLFHQREHNLRGLNFPRQLRRLTLSGWKLSWSDMRTIGSLPSLQVLKLRNLACIGIEWYTIEGEFRELRLLLIDQSYLRYWITEASHFPRLECLMLRHCFGLNWIPSNIGDIPTLKLIEVDDMCPRYLLTSAQRIEEKQRKSGNDSFQVRVKRSPYGGVRSPYGGVRSFSVAARN